MTTTPLSSSVPAHAFLQALEHSAERHDVVVDGTQVCWRRWGQGAPLVLLHGGSGNWAHWARNIAALSQRHTLWVPDMPSFGDSHTLPVLPDDPQLLDRLVHTLSKALDALLGAQTPINVAGFSFGGLVAGSLAAHRPKVHKLALLGTAGHGGPKRKVPELVKWRLPDPLQMRQALQENLGRLMLHHPHSIDALAMAIHEQASLATRFRSKSLSLDMDLQRTLKSFRRPVLMVWGEHDMLAAPELAAARLMDGHPERQFQLVTNAGHWVQFEASEPVNALLGAWFAP